MSALCLTVLCSEGHMIELCGKSSDYLYERFRVRGTINQKVSEIAKLSQPKIPTKVKALIILNLNLSQIIEVILKLGLLLLFHYLS